MSTIEPMDGVRARLRAALPTAMKARDRVATTALRSALAAIDAAEAVDPAAAGLRAVEHERIAGTVGGLGAGEVARATLTEDDLRAVLAREVAERRDAAAGYADRGQDEQAERLHAEADVLDGVLADA